VTAEEIKGFAAIVLQTRVLLAVKVEQSPLRAAL
jgi:hypothetical protein